jgi:hypothetical protein
MCVYGALPFESVLLAAPWKWELGTGGLAEERLTFVVKLL